MTERTYWQHPEGAVMWTVDGRPPSRFDRAGAWLPVAVIDAEDREAVERLAGALNRSLDFQPHSVLAEAVAAALADTLRKFANPKPPRPEEPTGFAAVVEDAEGSRWVNWRDPRATHAHSRPWVLEDDPNDSRAYADIDAARVLSEGVR